jgi:predicted nucleotidyltransferase
MRPETWVEDVLGTRAKARLLRRMNAEPGRVFTKRELAADLGMSPNTVSLAVQALQGQGVLEVHVLGRTHGVRLAGSQGLRRALASVFESEREVWKSLESAIRSALPRGVACYLYGSTARGEAAGESDVDLFLVAATQEGAEEAAHRVRSAVAETFPLRLDVIALGAPAFRRRKDGSLAKAVLREGRALSATRLEAFF